MSKKASTAALEKLHNKLAEKMIQLLEGETPPTAAEMAAIAKFLKDNSVTAIAAKDSNLGRLMEAVEGEQLSDEEFDNIKAQFAGQRPS